MIEFLPLSFSTENFHYLLFVLSIFSKYKKLLIDDYYPSDNQKLLNHLLNEINELYPWFLLVFYNNQPAGCVWISHWHGINGNYHSCQIHGCLDKKYWGAPATLALKALCKMLFEQYNLKRIQMEIPQYNTMAQAFALRNGFKFEGIIECATIKNSKPLNHYLFSLINKDKNL